MYIVYHRLLCLKIQDYSVLKTVRCCWRNFIDTRFYSTLFIIWNECENHSKHTHTRPNTNSTSTINSSTYSLVEDKALDFHAKITAAFAWHCKMKATCTLFMNCVCLCVYGWQLGGNSSSTVQLCLSHHQFSCINVYSPNIYFHLYRQCTNI